MTNVDIQNEADTCNQMCDDIKIIRYRATEKSTSLERTWTKYIPVLVQVYSNPRLHMMT